MNLIKIIDISFDAYGDDYASLQNPSVGTYRLLWKVEFFVLRQCLPTHIGYLRRPFFPVVFLSTLADERGSFAYRLMIFLQEELKVTLPKHSDWCRKYTNAVS